MKNMISWSASLLTLGLFFTMSATSARADKVSDFNAVKGKTGCESIPYSDLRRDCGRQQQGVKEWCKGGKGPVTCRPIDTKTMRTDLEQAKKRLDELKDELSDLKDSKSRAKDDAEKRQIEQAIRDKDKEIRVADDAVDDAEDKIEDARKEIDQIIKRIETCIDHREAVMVIFGRAKDKVAGEREPAVVPIARNLRDAYGASISGHRQAIDQKEDARDACRDRRRH